MNAPYHLVHIVSSGEYKSPLVASQVFDRAQVQATTGGDNKPLSVSVWIIAPIRDAFDHESKAIVERLRKRCPDVRITVAGGISRLRNWPIMPVLKGLRSRLGARTVYHCRGESSLVWACRVREVFKGDAAILDVRGFWPLERNAAAGVFDEKDMTAVQREQFYKDVALLKSSVATANGICTVSEPLRQYLLENVGAPVDTVVIPCCVKGVIPGTAREAARAELGLGDSTAMIYLGGTQPYQHIEDMVIPFMKSALAQSPGHVAVFITQDKDKMAGLLKKHGVEGSRVKLMSARQEDVGRYLTAMDMGLLLRASTIINDHAQPVKFGEYLSAGLPVILERGTWNAAAMLDKYGIGCVINIWGKTGAALDAEVLKALTWTAQNKALVRERTTTFVEQHYTWAANAPKERAMYLAALQKATEAR